MFVSVDRFHPIVVSSAFNWREGVTERASRGFMARLKKGPNKNHESARNAGPNGNVLTSEALARVLEDLD
jgi:hypothetical protein